MSRTSIAPDIADLDVPIDAWTRPFWEATAEHRILLPRCGDCGTFRWPPGPFCPQCQSQQVDWVPGGEARIYSFTVVRAKAADGSEASSIPALIEFPQAGGIRLLAAIVGAEPAHVRIGTTVVPDWIAAANAQVPVFTLRP